MEPEVMRFEVRDGVCAGETFAVGHRRVVVGRDLDCDVLLDDPEVSGEHVSLKMIDHHLEVHDLGSRTGTFVNGARIAAPTLVRSGDEVQIGSEVLVAVEIPAESAFASPTTATRSQAPLTAVSEIQQPAEPFPDAAIAAKRTARSNTRSPTTVAMVVSLAIVGIALAAFGVIRLAATDTVVTRLTAQRSALRAQQQILTVDGKTLAAAVRTADSSIGAFVDAAGVVDDKWGTTIAAKNAALDVLNGGGMPNSAQMAAVHSANDALATSVNAVAQRLVIAQQALAGVTKAINAASAAQQ